jgi:hypothetical protein
VCVCVCCVCVCTHSYTHTHTTHTHEHTPGYNVTNATGGQHGGEREPAHIWGKIAALLSENYGAVYGGEMKHIVRKKREFKKQKMSKNSKKSRVKAQIVSKC